MPDKPGTEGRASPEAMIQDETKHPIWCNGCDTDTHIFIEGARNPHWAPAGALDVAYFCAQCHSLYGHLVKESELQGKFAAAIAATRRR